MKKFTISTVLPASAEEIFKAWLSSKTHSAMTGSTAVFKKDGSFTAWDGYIEGKTLETIKNKQIVFAWRTSEFPETSADSRVAIFLDETNGKTKVTLTHSEMPEGQEEGYQKGWEEFYFRPMKEYFTKYGSYTRVN